MRATPSSQSGASGLASLDEGASPPEVASSAASDALPSPDGASLAPPSVALPSPLDPASPTLASFGPASMSAQWLHTQFVRPMQLLVQSPPVQSRMQLPVPEHIRSQPPPGQDTSQFPIPLQTKWQPPPVHVREQLPMPLHSGQLAAVHVVSELPMLMHAPSANADAVSAIETSHRDEVRESMRGV